MARPISILAVVVFPQPLSPTSASVSASLWYYVTRRLLQSIPLLFGVIIINFILIHIAPGSPVTILAGDLATPEYVEMMTKKLRLDRPLYEQLFAYVLAVIQGDLGYSFVFRLPVIELIGQKLTATLLLMFTAITISAVLAVMLGVIASKEPYSKIDTSATIMSLAGYSVPIFWLGQILILFFGVSGCISGSGLHLAKREVDRPRPRC